MQIAMGELLDLFDSISGWSWGWFLAAFLFALTLESWPHLRYAYWQWRIDRLFRISDEVHLDELRHLQWNQNEEPEPFDFFRVLSVSIQSALQLALPVILVDTVSADDLALAPAAVAAALFFANGRNPTGQAKEEQGERTGPIFPREAKIGFAVAVVFSVGLFLFLTQVMQV